MATTGQVFGQVQPPANVVTTLYAVPTTITYIIASIYIANMSTTGTDQFSVILNPSSIQIQSSNYIMYNVTIQPGETVNLTGITIPGNYTISVSSVNGNVAFTALGLSIS